MTIQAETHHTKKHKHSSRKHNKKKDSVTVTVNEKSPLIPKKKTAGHNEFNGASMSGAVMNLSTTIIGAGIMALPATVKVLGLGFGIVVIIIVDVLSEATVKIMLKHSKAGSVDSSGGLMGDVFGDLGKKMLEACVVINNIGVLIIYLIFLGNFTF